MTSIPETRYAKSGDTYVAYQIMGDGPFDLVFAPGFISHLEMQFDFMQFAAFVTKLSSFCRLIRFDKRGTGMSDRLSAIPTLEERVDDIRAVMDAAGSERAAVLGLSEGGAMAVAFAASYPKRCSELILYGALARSSWAPDYDWGRTEEQIAAALEFTRQNWGQGKSVDRYMPSLAHDESVRKYVGRFERASAAPGAAEALIKMGIGMDIRGILSTIRVPTLILHRTGDMSVNVLHGRYLAQHIPDARYVELPGVDHLPWAADADTVIGEIQAFLTGDRPAPDSHLDRVLATVLFTDIVDATKQVVDLGDRAWNEVLSRHNAIVREHLAKYRGREIDNAGDGFLSTFDGPARAVRCGQAIAESVKSLGIRVRAGVHTGECVVMGEKLGGVAVHIGSRIGNLAKGGEVLVSSVVRDLVSGSGLRFESRGTHALKGVPGEWHLLAAA